MFSRINTINKHDAFIFLFVLSIFYPLLKVFFISSNLAQIHVVILFVIFSVFFLFVFKQKRFKYPLYIFILIANCFCFFLISILYQSDIFRAFSDSFRFLFFCFFLLVGYQFTIKENLFFEIFLKISIALIIFSCFSFFVSLYPFVDLFKGRLSTDPLHHHFLRFSGTLGYPTEFSCFIIIPLIHIVRTKLYLHFNYFIITLVLLFGLFMSQSRGGFLLFGIFMLLFFLNLFLNLFVKQKISIRNVFFLFFFFSFFSILVFLYSDLFIQIFPYVFGVFDKIDSSILHRFQELSLSYNVLVGDLNIPVGYDRNTPFGLDTVESLIGFSVMKFGWFGLIFYFIYLFYFLYIVINNKSYSFYYSIIYWFFLVYLVVAPFSEVIYRSKGVVIFGLLIGLSLNNISRKYQNDFKH